MPTKDKTESQIKADTIRRESDKKEPQTTEVNLPREGASSRQALTLKRLGKIQEQIDESGLDRYKKELEEMYSQEETYFIKQKIKRMLSLSLDSLDIESKRIFIREHWSDICREVGRSKVIDSNTGEQITQDQIGNLNPLNAGDFSDSDIERYFNFYRKVAPYNYTTYENDRYEFFYDDKDIVDAYKMSETKYTLMYPSYYSRMAKGYCALYDSGKGNVMKFFKLNDDVERRIADRKRVEGDMQIRDLEDIIVEVEDALREGDASYLTKYIYFRKGLSQSIRNELDNKLSLDIPSGLDKKFFHEGEFRILLEKNRSEVKISSDPEELEALSISLKSLLTSRYETNAKENQGFKIENLNLLRNIAKGYGRVLDKAYYWFEDYLRDRRFFPNDLVKEFEKRFPINFEQYVTNDFPYFDKSFLKDIEKTKAPIREAFGWLSKEILLRIDKINGSRPELKEVSLDEILEKEGFSKESMGVKEYSTLIENYTALMELETRRGLENEFNIQLDDFSFREQIQFVNFLSNKAEDDIIRVKVFLEQGGEKNSRIKAFLSLENNERLGEEIINIGEHLINQPKSADLLFSEYAKLVDSAEGVADEVDALYKEIFFQKEIDRSELLRTILKRGSNLFAEASRNLANSKEEDKEKIILEMIDEFKYQQETQRKSLKYFKTMAGKLNEMYLELYKSQFEWDMSEEDLAERKKEMQEWNVEWEEKHKDKYSPEYLEMDRKVTAQFKRFDSQRIKEEIEHMRALSSFSPEVYEAIKASSDEQSAENYRKAQENHPDNARYEELIKKFEALLKYQREFERKLEQLVYGHESARLPENYQERLANEIEIYQKELPESDCPAYFLVGVSSHLPKEEEIHRKPIDALLWLFWLNNQGKKSDLLVADTIQRHNYQSFPSAERPQDPKLAALENGRRDRQWYSAVKQVFDLENIRMGSDPTRSDYEEIVEKNPEVQQQMEVLNQLRKESPTIGKALENLVEPTIRQRILEEDCSEEEKQRRLRSIDNYGQEEVALILALDGRKIGHKKELRYDMLARMIPIYNELKKRAAEIPELTSDVENIKNRDQVLVELSFQLAWLNDLPESYYQKAKLAIIEKQSREIKEKIKQQEGNQENVDKKARSDYRKSMQNLTVEAKAIKGALQAAMKSLQESKRTDLIEDVAKKLGITQNSKELALKWRELGKRLATQPWFKQLHLPEFFYPEGITSLSFDITEKGEYMNFREPYSTYKGEKEEQLSIEANQMIASSGLLAAAKVLVLSEKGQRTYFENVLRPLLVNFYLATSPSKEIAKQRLQYDIEEKTTISEIIDLIQKKIVWPVEMELGMRDQEAK